ncbi:Mpo1-like protein [Pseudoduganella plicata]|uniref:DUF962 domain-containing protein n=1 Tax=Pseudoduganella plicata TaxID=321984 RepID=A0A4P7BJP0_9BURK|nr:DUF962 domain-containing protein [Pseudoduganella plicata]QBQ37895.1 DUF962 domain-containing protein [Pseudoduganella plicata]GGZ10584.1 membrane protein [Pseudoduganella plicata]
MEKRFRTFREFYPYYLAEHDNRTCRRLHFIGSTLVLIVLATTLITRRWELLWLVPLLGYGFAWVGHYFFEHNRPATFTYPLFSLMGDWVMFRDMLIGRLRW